MRLAGTPSSKECGRDKPMSRRRWRVRTALPLTRRTTILSPRTGVRVGDRLRSRKHKPLEINRQQAAGYGLGFRASGAGVLA